MKISVNPKKYDLLSKIADAFGKIVTRRRTVTGMHLNPLDYFRLRINSTFYNQFDGETAFSLINAGVVGYFWGSTVKLDHDLKPGEVRFSTRKTVIAKAG